MKILLNNITNPKREGMHKITATIARFVKLKDGSAPDRIEEPITFERKLDGWNVVLDIHIAGAPAARGHEADAASREAFDDLLNMAIRNEVEAHEASRASIAPFFAVLFGK